MINKLDRLIVELRLTPAEAYARLQVRPFKCLSSGMDYPAAHVRTA